MITESATVIRCQEGRVVVEMQRQSACGHCELEYGCGTGLIGRLLSNRRKPIVVNTDRVLRTGDQVTLAIPDAAVVKASFLVYGLPLISMLIFGLVAHTLIKLEEWLVVLAAAAGFWVGFKLTAWLGRRLVQSLFTLDIVDIRVNPERIPES